MLYGQEPVPGRIDPLIQQIASLGFNSVFYVTKGYDGRTFYPSRFAQMQSDVLDELLDAGERHHVAIHAWFCTLTEGYRGKLGGAGKSNFIREHPEACAVDLQGRSTLTHPVACDYGLENFLCPFNPVGREHQIRLLRELASRPNLAGVLLDFVRYPLPGRFCYCSTCTAEFLKRYGCDPKSASPAAWQEWRVHVIHNMVHALARSIKEVSPTCRVTTLVWDLDASRDKGQDWLKWDVDHPMVMLYNKALGHSLDWVERRIDVISRAIPSRLICGIGGPFSHLFRTEEWRLLENVCAHYDVAGYFVGHYGVDAVLRGHAGDGIARSVSKRVRWRIQSAHQRARRYAGRMLRVAGLRDQR